MSASSRGISTRIILLTHYFPPEVGAPQTRLTALAAGLSERGIEVTVHTCPPHYPDGAIRSPFRNRLWQEERLDGVRVVRSAVLPAANRGFSRRLLDHASFAATATATAARSGPADVVVAESPPLFLAVAAVAYARRLRAPLILNVADLWPDSALELGALRPGAPLRTARVLERFAYRGAAAITTPTEGIASALEARPEATGKVARIAPTVDCGRFDLGPLSRGRGPLRVLYAGTVGMAQGLNTLIEAVRMAGPEVVRLKVAGGGADEAGLRRVGETIANVEMLGVRPSAEIPELYRNTHVAAVLLRDVPLFRGALPTKMFEAMAARRPLVLSAAGESAAVVERSGSGVVVNPEDPEALADEFRRLGAASEAELRAMGEAGREVAGNHDLGSALDRWQNLLQSVARRDLGPGRNPNG